MPIKRTKAKRSLRLDDYRRQQLLEGPDAVLLAGVGYLRNAASFADMCPADQAATLDEMRADWGRHRGELMAWWLSGGSAGGSSIMIFANPVQAVAINVLAANGAGYPVIPAPSLSVGTIVAVEAAAFASGFSGLPEVSVGREPVIHYENSAPAQIGTAGTPNVVAAPVRSVWQTNTLALRLILPTAWAMRGIGLVQVINGATW